jgi:ketosteroid isomerase-like protein
MRTARELLQELLETMARWPEAAPELFADDGIYEAPYLESLGIPWRYRGRVEVAQHLGAVRELFPRLSFHDLTIVAETPECVIAEYQFTTRSSRTGRVIHQLIVGRLESANGRIALLRESVNLVELAFALFRRGPADDRIPSDRDTWPDP